MGHIIIITEKPSVAMEYKRVLGISGEKKDGYAEGHSPVLNKDVIITWAVGHLVSLADAPKQNPVWDTPSWKDNKCNLPMIPKYYKYQVLPNTEKQYGIIRRLYTAKDVDCIYYAGDSGREGIYIQALIRNQIFGLECMDYENPHCDEKVVWIDSQTEEEILRGIREAKPYKAYLNMVISGYMRAISDWLIGINFTQACSVTTGCYIAVGRVMTVVLAMIVHLQKMIDDFKKTDFYGFKAFHENPFMDARWKAPANSKWESMLYNENGFLKREDAEKLLQQFLANPVLTVEKAERKEKKEYAPYLFNLAELQNFCSKRFHISPSDTLNIAQDLYEDKLISYPRTDSRFLTNAVAKDIEDRVGKKVPSRYIDDSKVTDHYALIPTGKDASGLSGLKQGVYDAINTRFYAIFEAPYVYDTVSTVYVHANGERFYESVTDVKQLGYKELYGEKKPNVIITEHKVGEVISGVDFDINAMETKPPAPYTTGSLILAMEKAGKLIEDEELREQIKSCGIGTSATRAGIIEKLASDKLKYIEIDKKTQKIAPTKVGTEIVEIIEKFDAQLVSPEKTAEMEQRLQDIVDGNMSREQYTEIINDYVTKLTDTILNSGVHVNSASYGSKGATVLGKCPKCGSDVVTGKFGAYCTGKCGMGISKIMGTDLTAKQISSLLSGKPIKFKSAKGYELVATPEVVETEYQGKIYYNWKSDFANKSGGTASNGEAFGKCPKCGGEICSGQYGLYCKGRCGMNVSKVFGVALTEKQIKSLLSGKETSVKTPKGGLKVLPEVVENQVQDKTYYNWKTEKE